MIHGHARKRCNSREYRIWASMLHRCSDPTFPHYGERGIKVCERWRSFVAFLEDMGKAPSGCSLDRINVNGDYEPSNCRWATREQQDNNTTRTVLVTHNGETLSLTQWSERTGIPVNALRYRYGHNWTTERMLTTPTKSLRYGTSRKVQNTPEYISWMGMKQRCNNSSRASYHRYGGRGIGYCPRWELFKNFLADMGLRPKGMSLDRIDTDKDYCPENCRWATPSQQARNRQKKVVGDAI